MPNQCAPVMTATMEARVAQLGTCTSTGVRLLYVGSNTPPSKSGTSNRGRAAPKAGADALRKRSARVGFQGPAHGAVCTTTLQLLLGSKGNRDDTSVSHRPSRRL